jgi:uncharacterized protein
MPVDADAAQGFIADVRENPINAALIDRLPTLGLDDCWLVAGCLFQTVWNRRAGRPPTENIRDYDVFYFDGADLSYEAEDFEIRRLASAFADLDATIELKNQARVHLWYRQRFGHDYPQLAACTDGIDRFLITCTCVGIRCAPGEPRAVHASYGLDQLYAGILCPNPLNMAAGRFAEKAASYQARWPWLRIDVESAACRN